VVFVAGSRFQNRSGSALDSRGAALPDTDQASGPFWSPDGSDRLFGAPLGRIAIDGVESKVLPMACRAAEAEPPE
jgi:hypothetical protein